MFKYKRIILKLLIITSVILSFPIYFVFANPLDSWQSPKAYKPKPILFLHGFAKGRPLDWNGTKAALTVYFSKYQSLGPYLETIDFQDSNGSVDRYPSGKFNPQGNSAGWADKVKDKVDELLSSTKYGFYTNKINLVCHSMGGLAARWYLANYSSNFVDKLILIGVPNLGSRWAELANAASKVPKVGWLNVLTTNGLMSIAREDLNFALWFFREIDVYGEAVDDMDPSPTTGSGFINNLNSLPQSQSISYYGIIGIVGSFMNRYIANGDYYGGDCIVSKTSQLGTGNVSYKEWSQINANHWQEIKVAGEGTFSSILYFLDSAKPELEVTYPGPGTTEIYESSIHIRGEIFKEYLPADSTLHLKVVRESDGATVLDEDRPDSIKPSGLWIPNNPDSPVAEFDEVVTFSGKGTYKISCQLKNPAGLFSDTKEFLVKVNVFEGTNIIVHCHNPEGKEIASIQGVCQNSVEIYDGNTRIGYGAYNAETHNKPIAISTGAHTIKAKFNGMTKEETLTLNPNETKIITFIFSRISIDNSTLLTYNRNSSGSRTVEMEGQGRTVYQFGITSLGETSNDWMWELYPGYNDVFGALAATVEWGGSSGYGEGTLELNGSLSYSITPSSVNITFNGSIVLGGVDIKLYPGYPYFWSAYIGVGGATTIPISISPNNSFKSWFLQQYSTQGGDVEARICSATIRSVLVHKDAGYFLNTIDAGLTYDGIYIYNEGKGVKCFEEVTSFSSSPTITNSLLGSSVKMSSVPYDLLDTAI